MEENLPDDYYQNFAKNVLQWSAANENGEVLAHIKLSKDGWKVKTEGSKALSPAGIGTRVVGRITQSYVSGNVKN